MAGNSDYVETRYYSMGADAIGGNESYEKLVKLNTEFNIGSGGNTETTNSFIDSRLYSKFNITKFNEFFANEIFDVAKLISYIRDNSLTPLQDPLQEYITEIKDVSASNNYIIDKHVVYLAIKVTHYFLISSALYTLIYASKTTISKGETAERNMEYTGTSQIDDKHPSFLFTDINIEVLYDLYTSLIEDLKFDSGDDAKNTHSNFLHKNFDLNNKFNQNDIQLNDKQQIFDSKKAFVITMMAKSHKANKLFSNKRFWFMVYTILILIYIFATLGFVFMANSNNVTFSMFQSAMSGIVILSLNSFILMIMLILEISNYFKK